MVSSKMSALIPVLLVILVATRVAEGQSNIPSCASKLVPCADYLNSTNPPASCCDPLKEAVTKELSCLCNLYANPSILTAFRINITQALELPAHCGISNDTSACKAQGPSSSQPPPATPGGGNNGGSGKIAVTGLSGLLLIIMASLMLC